MGPKHQNSQQQEPSPQLKINHQKFQHFVYNQQSDQLQLSLDVQNERDIKVWHNNLQRTNQFEDKQNLLLPQKHQFVQKGFCGNAGICKIFYENYPYLFQEEIENRIQMNKYFEEEELWYLLYSLVCSAQDFKKLDSKIGDVRPYNIFINEEGQIKIANLYSWPYERTNFDRTAYEKTLTYVAPEEIKLIAKGMQDNMLNKVTAESFSIGLTVLQSGLLFNAKQLYSMRDMTFNAEQLNNKVVNWHNLEYSVENGGYRKYSPLLRNIVAGMCNPDDRERLISLQVEELLRPYSNQILNLREFNTQDIKLPYKTIIDQKEEPPVYYEMDRQRVTVQSPTRVVMQSRPQTVGRPELQPRSVQSPTRVVMQSRPQTMGRPQSQSRSPAPLIIPQQTVVVNRIQPKVNSDYRPVSVGNPNVHYNGQYEGIPLGGREPAKVNFSQLRTQQVPVNVHEHQFHKYASNQPEPVRVTRIEGNGPTPVNYEQQFHKYSVMNQPAEVVGSSNNSTGFRNTTTSVITSNHNNAVNYNSQGYNVSPKPWELPPAPTTATSQFAPRPYSSVQGSTQVVSSISGPSSGEGSDFLRRIDQQLEASRKQFPPS